MAPGGLGCEYLEYNVSKNNSINVGRTNRYTGISSSMSNNTRKSGTERTTMSRSLRWVMDQTSDDRRQQVHRIETVKKGKENGGWRFFIGATQLTEADWIG
ncbi:hypothetical protein TRVA0_117S00122 [Trichomonascus vanleenenianus]|uniref:uncharacterized protein n=1 Tax=Trichomonascus vanleenenianus TaxID=2268995 RepID=UPI003ECB42C9